jgi:hypothetical protein
MLDITDYTSYEEVRATIGLSSDELPDSVLALEIYANGLELELDSVTMSTGTPLKTMFITLTNSEADQYIYNLTRMFSAYAVAIEVATSLSMRAPKTISDSKVSITRFSPEATWQDVIEALNLKFKSMKTRLEAIGAAAATATTYIYKVVPDYDPVTGE